ncbi:MAG: protease complex subunit PrcB family protein [Deltaproteobacteria bacterium]|nr:protease complex subunit PrcB family protein [Deltaproteobacteria bacterium]
MTRDPLASIITIVVMTVLALFFLSSCHLRGTELHFVGVEQRQTPRIGKLHESKEPGLMIIGRPQELAQVYPFVSPDAQLLLEEVDFDDYFVAVVFQGWKPTDSYGAQVRRITQTDEVVTLYAHFTERDPERVAAHVVTSPYHVVKVRRPDPTGKEIEFLLNADGRVVSSRKHFIP